MREINTDQITEAVRKIVIEASYDLGSDVIDAVKKAKTVEESPVAKGILDQVLANAEIAKNEHSPMCQDTGFAVLFVELGQDVKIVGGNYGDALGSVAVTPKASCASRS